MNPKLLSTIFQRIGLALSFIITPLLLTASAAVVQQSDADASSHREAPLISQDQYADNTDTYAFISPRDDDNIVLAASWIPFEGPEGGPNYFEWGNGVTYNIHVDNDGDAVADFTYALTSRIDIQFPETFLYNIGPIKKPSDDTWNRRQYITVKELREDGTVITLVDDKLTSPVNIGSKSTPNYRKLAKKARFKIRSEGDKIKIFAGQTDDAFWVDLQVFDLLTLRGQEEPIGYEDGNNTPVDSVSGFNVHSLVLEIPIERLKQGEEPVLGVWATAQRPSTRVLNGPAGLGSLTNSGDLVQVSRLGMPLTNELVLPYALKDAFNSIDPSVDAALYTGAAGPDIQALLQRSVEDPEVGFLLCDFYGVPLPGDSNGDCSTEFEVGTLRSGRGDIFDIFLTGMVLANDFTIQTEDGPLTLLAGSNVNRPRFSDPDNDVVPADMLRINTDIKDELCPKHPSRLGVLAGDACGFPNGRRLFDDIVEIELLAVAGAAYQVLDGRDAGFTFNPALIDILTDGVDFNDVPFQRKFPYMGLAQSGQEHFHQNATNDRDDRDDYVSAASLDLEDEYIELDAIVEIRGDSMKAGGDAMETQSDDTFFPLIAY